MLGIGLVVVVLCMALGLVLAGNQSSKRGCGRGCATCGNRNICHKNSQK